MKHLFSALLLALSLCAFGAAEPEISFSFEKGAAPDAPVPLLSGKGKSGLKPHFDKDGDPGRMIVPGLSGQALRVGSSPEQKGHDAVTYYLQSGIMAAAQGSFSFWMKAVDWNQDNRKSHAFVRLMSQDQESLVAVAQNLRGSYRVRLLGGVLKDGVRNPSVEAMKADWQMGEWHHIAVTWGKGKMSLYLDGEFVGARDVPAAKNDYRLLYLGQRWDKDPGITLIDELRFFRRTLTDAEVRDEFRRLAGAASGGHRTFEVKLSPRSPRLDGAVEPAEYAAGFALMHETRNKQTGFYAEYQPRCYLSYDRENLYFAMVSSGDLRRMIKERDGNVWEDDCIEFYVSKSGTHTDIYHFIINADCAVYDSRVSAGREIKSFNAEGVQLKSKVVDGRWVLEAAFPWRTFGFSPADTESFYFNLCRSYRGNPKGDFAGDLNRHASEGRNDIRRCSVSVSSGAFADASGFGKIIFSPGAPAFELSPVGRLIKGEVDSRLDFFPAADDVLTARLSTGNGPGAFRFEKALKCAAGKTANQAIRGKCASNGTLTVRLDSAAAGELLRAKLAYEKPTLLKFRSFVADPPKMQLIFTTEGGDDSGEACFVRIRMKDWKTGSIVYDATQPLKLRRGIITQRFDLTALPPGVFDLLYTFTDKTGKVLADDYGYFAKPDGKAPWEGTTAGAGDIVPEPWTLPEADDTVFSCWGRKYTLGGNGLVSSVTSQGKELLSRPVTLVLDGKKLEFSSKLVKKGKSFAEYLLTAKNGVPVTAEIRAEFDGFLWITVHAGKAGFKAKSLRLEYPVNRKYSHVFDDCSTIYVKQDFAKWSDKTIFNDPTQKPFFWIGGPEIGLMGGIDSCRGWYCKDKKKAASLKVSPEEAVVSLAFIDTPVEMKAPRKIEFYLQATPSKKKSLIAADLDPLTVRMTWHPTRFFEWKAPGQVNDSHMQQFLAMEKTQGIHWWHYFGTKGSSPRFPWWGWYGPDWNMLGDPAWFQQETPTADRAAMDRGIWTWTCMNSRNFFDHKIENVRYYLGVDKYKVRDIYFDLAWPYPCRNAVHGCLWKDEFGFTHSDYDMKALREFHKRAYIMMKQKTPNAVMKGHVRYTRCPSDNFFDILTVGESYERQIAEKHNYYEVFVPETLRMLYGYRTNEFTIQLGPQIFRTIQVYNRNKLKDFNPDDPKIDKAQRHYLAYVESFGFTRHIYWRRTNGEKQLIQLGEAKNTLGRLPKFYCFWDKTCGIRAEKDHPRFIYSAYAGNGKVLVIALNDTDKPMRNAVVVDGAKLPMPSAEGKEVFSGRKYAFSDGKIVFDLPPRESAFVMFEK